MSEGKFDKVKGRAKEAIGDLTGDDELKGEGKVDRASGATKNKVGAFFDRIKKTFRRGRGRGRGRGPGTSEGPT